MLDTPSILIDQKKMQSNIEKIAGIARQYGVSLRPHSKTHKNPELAKRQITAGAKGICVAKVSEAEVMAQHGIDDIFIAFPIVTEYKIERLVRLAKQIKLIVGIDSLEGALNIAKVAKKHMTPIKVRLEIDIGLKRTGVVYEDAIQLAHQISEIEYLDFKGIYTYRGAFMNGQSTLDVERAGLEEGRLMVRLAEQMREQGIVVEDVSVGSTPTAPYAAQVKGITEVRPGTYIFYDRMQAALGACSLEECAAVVCVTVVSRPTEDRIVIDGGSKTFATDVGPNIDPLNLQGFGHILEYPHAIIERLSEEHGMVTVKPSDSMKVGDILHIIPNHICSTINLHNHFYFSHGDHLEKKLVSGRGMLT